VRSLDELKGFLGESYKGDIKGLKPKKRWTDKGRKKMMESRRFPITELYVKWIINDKVRRA
jgi:hypothetical protein